MNRLTRLLVTLVVVALTPAIVLAAPPEAPGPVPVRVTTFQEEAGSAKLFSDLRLEELDDGTRRLVASRTTRSRVVDETYFFVIDQSKGTYRARRLPEGAAKSAELIYDELAAYPGVPHRSEAAQALAARSSTRLSRSPSLEGMEVYGEFEEPPPLCDEIEECEYECSGSWSARVTTYDPIYVSLTETSAFSDWGTLQLRYCKWMKTGFNGCWAANPSSLGTHWYVSSCGRQGPYGGDYSYDFTALGSYYNYDFGLNSLITTVSQNIRIRLQGSIGVVTSWNHTDGGEFSYLIFGSYQQSGQNTCF